ncbi:MAG: sulfite exporter TauE/SafE family protein [Nocardioidaceae bacterium]|nr:sulfite exporter TauE/SafE family protein [Nocardioidaceae bacterium]
MITSVWEALAVLLAGVAAGTINAVVGSGTLVTFPVLLAIGLSPVTANVSNNVGMTAGSLSAVAGYRRELAGQRHRVVRLASASLIGSVMGAVLLLVLPGSAFKAIVPVLIGLGVVLVVVGPRLQRRVAARAERRGGHGDAPWLWPAVLGTGVYGGYFGAAQGVLLLAVLGIGVDDTMQRHNAVKNVLAFVANGVAALVFVVVTHVDWRAAALVAAGSVVGGQVGSTYGKRLPNEVFRVIIVVVGVVAIVSLLLK